MYPPSHDFLKAKELTKHNFRTLMMAAIRKADTSDIQALRKAFPGLVDETIARGNAVDGVLATDKVKP